MRRDRTFPWGGGGGARRVGDAARTHLLERAQVERDAVAPLLRLGGVGAAELQLCATRLREVHLEDEAVLGLRDAVSGCDRGIQEEVDAIGPLRVG